MTIAKAKLITPMLSPPLTSLVGLCHGIPFSFALARSNTDTRHEFALRDGPLRHREAFLELLEAGVLVDPPEGAGEAEVDELRLAELAEREGAAA